MTIVLEGTAEERLAGIRKYTRVSGGVSSAGQPSMEQFMRLREAGFEAIVNLLPEERTEADEESVVRGLGMEYVHIPVVWAAPQLVDVERFFAAMDSFAGRRVLVHCAVNMRASAFVYLYRIACLGADPEEAEIDLHDIWIPEGVWAKLIETVLSQRAKV